MPLAFAIESLGGHQAAPRLGLRFESEEESMHRNRQFVAVVGLALCATASVTDANKLDVGPGGLSVFQLAPPTSDCYVGRNTPGCEIQQCETVVCDLDDFCCVQWDAVCADIARAECAARVGVGRSVDSSFAQGLHVRGTAVLDGTLEVSGDAFKPGGGPWSVASDARLKTNIEQVRTGMLDRLLRLRSYTFSYREDAIRSGLATEGVKLGLLAQEVREVFPSWVDEGYGGYLYVTERSLTPILVDALRELRSEKDAEIAGLRAEVKLLHERLDRLERDTVVKAHLGH